jgi:hypothetical protein
MNSSDAVSVLAPNPAAAVPLAESSDPSLVDSVNGKAVANPARPGRRLLIRPEVLQMLQLNEEQVQGLVNTRQIVPIRIAGEERFDSRDLERLIDSYRTTALRRAQ